MVVAACSHAAVASNLHTRGQTGNLHLCSGRGGRVAVRQRQRQLPQRQVTLLPGCSICCRAGPQLPGILEHPAGSIAVARCYAIL
jgi:hypothetical protein